MAEKTEVNKIEVYNIGNLEYINVKQSIKLITNLMSINPKIIFGKEKRGWVGDSPMIQLENKKIKALGWVPKFSISESIKQTVGWLLKNEWVYKERK